MGPIGAALLVIIVVVIVIACGIALNDRPRNSEGVVMIDNNTARIHHGDTLVLTSSCGKSCIHTWLVTWDDQNVVHVDDNGALTGAHYTGTLCGIDCQTKVDMGWLSGSVDITERSDESVEVHWSWLWGYRQYEASK